jgi:hypothetical protein
LEVDVAAVMADDRIFKPSTLNRVAASAKIRWRLALRNVRL